MGMGVNVFVKAVYGVVGVIPEGIDQIFLQNVVVPAVAAVKDTVVGIGEIFMLYKIFIHKNFLRKECRFP